MSKDKDEKTGIEALAELGRKALERRKQLAEETLEKADQAKGSKKSESRKPDSGKPDDLGILDVRRYLEAHGRKIDKEKEVNGDTWFCLEACIFDENHRKNESAVCKTPEGMLYYKCFHDSCVDRTWKEARQIISGDELLLEFYSGYDPTLDRAGKGKALAKPYLILEEGKRPKFNASIMADTLVEHYAPVICEGPDYGSQFYSYSKKAGLWKFLPVATINHRITTELGDHAMPHRRESTRSLFGDKVYVAPEDLKPDPNWLNMKNGMFLLPTMVREDHDPKFNSRIQLPIEYRKDAECPLWIETLEQIFADDHAKIGVLQQFFGYSIWPKLLFPAALFQIGNSMAGKSSVTRVLHKLVGKENISHISLKRMEQRFGVAELKDKLLNTVGESSIRPQEVTAFKSISAGDSQQGDRKFLPDVIFEPFAKHVFSMNEYPQILDRSDAFFRRMIPLRYEQKFEGENDNKHLYEDLMQEIDGIFCWAIVGLKKTLEIERIDIPDSVRQTAKELREESNHLIGFTEEECILGPEYSVLPRSLFKAYRDWFEASGMKIRDRLIQRDFYRTMRQTVPGVDIQKRRIGTRDYFYGIGLRDHEAEPELPYKDKVPF